MGATSNTGGTIVEELASFASRSDYASLPPAVVAESKRVLLDSIGCGISGVDAPKGSIGTDIAKLSLPAGGEATVMGSSTPSSILGAVFANAELVSALDFCAILSPGHVAPVVVPIALGAAEVEGTSGSDLLAAIAVGHEISCRIAVAMDGLRDVVDGEIVQRKIVGYSCIVFGAAATSAMLMGLERVVTASALGIAGSIAPVHSQGAWSMHAPSTTVKYLVAGNLSQTALTATYLARFGHVGDTRMLDDADFGFPRFIGTERWAPEGITTGLGEEWRFPGMQSYKTYPHCRTLHPMIEAVKSVVEEHDLKPDEIEQIRGFGESWNRQPTWLNRTIDNVIDAQTSMAHGISLAAHRTPATKAWQSPDMVFDRSVLNLMDKVVTDTHPQYIEHLTTNPASRPARVEIDARGRTFTGERLYSRGGPSPDPSTTLTTDELVDKFLSNVDGVLPGTTADAVIDAVLGLESIEDVRKLTALLRPDA